MPEKKDIKGYSVEVSLGNEEHIIRKWRKCNPWKAEVKNLAELYSSILWKVEPRSDTIQSLKIVIKMLKKQLGSSWLLLLKCKR